MGTVVLILILPIVCYLGWLFVKLQRLSRRQGWLRSRLTAQGMGRTVHSRRGRHRRKE